MKREMSHEEAFAELDAAALDALDSIERDAVLAHVDACEICRAELDVLRAVTAQLAYAAPLGAHAAVASYDRVGARLMARVAADASATPIEQRQLETEAKTSAEVRAARARVINMLAWRRAEWMAMAASILMIVSIGLLASVLRDRENLRAALQVELAQGQHVRISSDSLRVAVMSRDSVIAGLTGKNVAVMSLTASGANAPFARMFWDQTHNTWTLVAHNMPALKPGRTYQLWLVTPAAKISAGTFDPRNGDAIVRATYALAPADLKALAVTEEPAGGMPQPTGSLVLAVTAS